MHRLPRLALVVTAAAGIACRAASPPPPPPAPAPAPAATPATPAMPATPAATAEHAHASEPAGLRLDDGKRWKANAETTAGVARMKEIVGGVDAAAATDVATFRGLASQLQAELDGVIARCTMTGEAHEQLHAFLIPLFSHVARLKEGSLDEAREAAVAMSAALKEYDAFFE